MLRAGGILLCMGLFSRFCVRAPRWTTHSASKTRVTELVEALPLRCAGLSDQDRGGGMRLSHQLRWSPHAPSNSADATSTVSLGQATARSNAFVVATDPTNPLTRG